MDVDDTELLTTTKDASADASTFNKHMFRELTSTSDTGTNHRDNTTCMRAGTM